MANASEPEPASERQKEEASVVARRGSHSSWSSLEPQNLMALLVSVF